jgi:hypothetical protein
MPVSRQQAVVNALQSTAYPVGMCAKWTREKYGLPALGDFDRDGDADAVDMWQACVLKEAGDRNPPAGVPVFWSGGSKGHGHAAISLGDGFVRTIDRPRSGVVSTVPLAEIEQAWGLKYLGWTIDLYGHEIPDPEGDLRRAREAKLAKAKARGAKWKRWLDRNRAYRARLRKALGK